MTADVRLWIATPPANPLAERVAAELAEAEGAMSTTQIAERLRAPVADVLAALRDLQRASRASGWIDGAAPLEDRVVAALEDAGGAATTTWIARKAGLGTSLADVEAVLLELQGVGRAAPCVATPGTWMLTKAKEG